MDTILVQRPTAAQLDEMRTWPVWSKGISTFPWHYDTAETCYFLQGDVVVTPEGGTPVPMGTGDRVTFPAGMSCVWEIRQPVKKHYSFD